MNIMGFELIPHIINGSQQHAWRTSPESKGARGMYLRAPVKLSNGQVIWSEGCADERGEPICAITSNQ